MNIWAHRGCSYNYPENTLSAFQAACGYEITGIELDIQLSKDGEIVVIHDEKVDRTTDGSGAVADMTLQELKKLKITPRAGSGLAYETIPTMREVLELLREYCLRDGLLINIELKNSIVRYEGMEQKILHMVHEYELEPYIIYSSFNPDSIRLLKELDSSVRTGILNSSLKTCLDISNQFPVDALHPYINEIDVDDIRRRTKLPVRAWNIWQQEPFFPDQREIIIWNLAELEQKGITDIFTNGPETYVPRRLCEKETAIVLNKNRSINAETGYIERTEEPVAATEHFYLAPAGSVLRWKDSAYCYQIFLYSMETEENLIYTYCYQQEENWATYLPDMHKDEWLTEDYRFPVDGYFRIMVKRTVDLAAEDEDGKAKANRSGADTNFPKSEDLMEFYQGKTGTYRWLDCFQEEAERTIAGVEQIRKRGDLTFLLLADTHYVNNGTWEDTAYNLKRVAEQVQPDAVVHLGDFTDGMLSLDLCREYTDKVLGVLHELGAPVYLCLGNHDSNYFRNNPEKMTQEEMSRYYLQREEPWYFIDFPQNKLRVLFLYSFDYREQVRYGFPSEELEWVRQTLADTRQGWSVLVFAHVPPLSEIHYWSDEIRNGEALIEILEEYHAGEGHRIMAYIHGHNHAEQIYMERSFPIISIGCNKLEDFKDKKPEGAFTPDRKRHTVTQDLWDVMVISRDNARIDFVRFGAGEDRTVELARNPKEEKYIRYRKRKAMREGLLYDAFRLLPVNSRKIAVCTFEGKGGFCCNPRYIVEELHRRNPDCQFVWLVNDLSKKFPEYIKPVKNTLWNRAFHLSTAKVWIDNYRKPYGTKKRKGQYYLQTWHGALAFKTLGRWRGKGFSEIACLVSKNDADMTDYVICDSEWGRQVYPKGLVYDGEYLKFGSARCDILVNSRAEQYKKIRERYQLPQDAKLVMYAPTFRETAKDGVRGVFVEENTLDFARMIRNLQEKFSGEWYLFLRLHPQLASKMKEYPLEGIEGYTIDVSQADDMCEVMAGVDLLVTDYSSAAMDAGFAGIPVLLYADDLEQYTRDRGGMFWIFPESGAGPIVSNPENTPGGIEAVLPYLLARNNEELEENIRGFDQKVYERKVQAFAEAIGLVNDGHAAERAAEQVEKWMKGDGQGQ